MEISFTRGYFPAYSAGIFHFCTGDYLGSISQFFGSRNPGAGGKLGKYASGEQTCFFKGALDDVMSGIAVIVCVLSLNLLGDGLRDFLDPKTKGGAGK